MNDTLSDGLEFDSDSVVVTITAKTTNTTTTLIKDTDYYVYTDDDASPYTFRIAFKDIMEYTIGDAIVVTYSATLTEEAESGLSGNSNSSSITYSNDPTDSGKGDNEPEPGLPDSDVPTGVTPESITLTFTTGITITKVDENGAELSGATFTLTGTSTQYVLKGGTYFEIDNTNGTYWLLTDGTYTTTSPDTAGINTTVYVTNSSGEYDKYTKTYASTSGAVAKNVYLTATSGSDGIVTFSTLGEGTYTITETEAPSGYNTADPVTVVITLDGPTTVSTGNEEAEWSYDGSSSDVSVDSNGNYIITIMDQKGSSLPSTGGTGTTIFYVVGIVLMLGVAVVLVTKKRIGSDK
ncbi:MAG: isopeptide-forming domain-containing fimbrial protein [Clostridiales bacterium]|nr:isopeptide-forming domain-containing fimbrial protein [Clostridiales bacterium]